MKDKDKSIYVSRELMEYLYGYAFLADGEKALKRTTIFGFGKSQKYEDAAEAFTKAGNAFKLANLWESAGDAFIKAAECENEVIYSSNKLVEAANSYKKINPVKAIKTFYRVIENYNEAGKFSQSARYYQEVGEIYEVDGNTEGAQEAYQQAANLLLGENKTQIATKCLLKVATLASGHDDFAKAADIFESIGRASMETRSSAYSAKGYLLQCCLCHLALGDAVALRGKLDEFKSVDYSFPSSRECEFLEKLLTAFDGCNTEDFSQTCADFDRVSPLDPWKTTVLLKAKRHIDAATGEDPDGDDDVDMT